MAKIAVLGYGTVGSGVVEVLETNKNSIEKRAGEGIEVKYVLDLRDFPGDPVQEKIVHDVDIIIQDKEIDVVVEVMGGIEPAFTFVKKALEAGKSVCTSNKALVAEHGPELLAMAKERNLNFMFEASVGGGIPIIRPLNQSLTADEITQITGILNGTTNYILTKMSQEGSSYEDVLKEIPRVRKDLGYPPLVTPLSQMVGTQAVFNVLLGERYKVIPKEIRDYVKGLYGMTPAPIDKEIQKKIIGDVEPLKCRPADLIEPEMEKLTKEIGELAKSTEDVLMYALFPENAKKFLENRDKPQVEEYEINLFI